MTRSGSRLSVPDHIQIMAGSLGFLTGSGLDFALFLLLDLDMPVKRVRKFKNEKTITGCQEKKCKKEGECGISADMREGPLMWQNRDTTLIGRRGRAPDAAKEKGP